MSDIAQTQFFVSGMKCDGCIAKAEQALANVPGYDHAKFNLLEGTAVVYGNFDPQAIIQALSETGYAAVVKSA